MKHVHIHITGIVQGVGMRPFVYREAVAHGVTGWVLNAGDGVHIEAHAEDEAFKAFMRCLRTHAPATSRIDSVNVTPLDCAAVDAPNDFRIIASEDDTAHTTLVSPDIATCDDCLRELFGPADRRYHYPFINCTNCGPRFTIIRDLPYDRAQTSMGAFPMCPACAVEYADPLDRRFHAQPNACFECGPHITWRERGGAGTCAGDTLEASDAIIERCAELLAHGCIVAIKGLGGFHLACRADSEEAVRELRRRKRRSNKPLAIMVRDLASAEALCHIDAVELSVLTGSARPIVLLKRHAIAIQAEMAQRLAQGTHNLRVLGSPSNSPSVTPPNLAHSIAFDLPELGVMLPYTPLQHLLLAACTARDAPALVMTSGNVSGAPIEIDDESAWAHLVEGGIADALLGNNREILSRFDDSVVRVVNGHVQMVRRARGYAPQPIALPAASPHNKDLCILACGSEQKATLALTREQSGGTAACFVSQHVGDLENAEALDAWGAARARMETLFDLHPTVLACDAHPGYLSSQWARGQARKTGLPLVEVQHHHAHIASVIAEAASRGEHDSNKPVIGIALDGTGAGATYNQEGNLELDGTIWGGEILIANLRTFERASHLKPWPLPGGAASIRDPRRNALALLHSYGLLDHPGAKALLNSMAPEEQSLTLQMLERNINCPLTSSMGRLLDAISAILGICTHATYEGEPAILLEAAATKSVTRPIEPFSNAAPSAVISEDALPKHTIAADTSETDVAPISCESLLGALLDELASGTTAERVALHAHDAIARLVSESAFRIARANGLHTVALSGGVFMNRLLLESIHSHLKAASITVLLPHDLPFNDGCIAYGQAAVAHSLYENTQMLG